MSDLEGVLARLVRGSVRFVIVGGYAAAAHGSTLVTMDVDICCDMSEENLLRLQNALEGLHPVQRLTTKRLPLSLIPGNCRGLKNLYLDTDEGQLDCLGAVTGLGEFARVWSELSEEVELPFGVCRVLTLDSVILAKKAMDRPKDRETVVQLEFLRRKKRRNRE